MYPIVKKSMLTPTMAMMHVKAPWVARKAQPGQFIIVRLGEEGERIPLSLSGWDREEGTLRLIIQAAGATTRQMVALNEGDAFTDLVGPLGQRAHGLGTGTLVVIGGGYGAGAVMPTAREAKAEGRRVIGIVGARSKDLVLLEDEMRSVCDDVLITTDDGSHGIKGLVTDALKIVIDREPVGAVLAIGPVPMMRAVSELTRPRQIKTMVSLNAVMVDGTGMCGGCRVTVGGQTKFACYDGPDFDGHQVDFDELVLRQRMYRPMEAAALDHICNIEKAMP
jgi:ferredoxin--NADP+ reductase